MNITFIYNGKIISTPNLDKKLKRMKLTLDDIQIIDNVDKPKKLIKDLNHLKNCYEGIYSNGFECYYENEDEFPNAIGDYELIKIRPFKEWSMDYIE